MYQNHEIIEFKNSEKGSKEHPTQHATLFLLIVLHEYIRLLLYILHLQRTV